jgi:hypothetical protein
MPHAACGMTYRLQLTVYGIRHCIRHMHTEYAFVYGIRLANGLRNMAMRATVCGCPAVRQCAAVCMRQCARLLVCDSAWRSSICGSAIGSVRQCMALCGCDNPLVGKHLDENTRLLAEILLLSTICIQLRLSRDINQCSSSTIYTL